MADTALATSEPRRPLLVWAASGLSWLGAGWLIGTLLLAMWVSVHDYGHASRLSAMLHLTMGDPVRIVPMIGLWLLSVAVATLAVMAGYYCFWGFAWPRWFGLIPLALSGLTWFGHPWAVLAAAAFAVAAALTWTSPVRTFAAAWDGVRHPAPPLIRPTDAVVYGPVSRYRIPE